MNCNSPAGDTVRAATAELPPLPAILLVDDDPFTLHLHALMLLRMGLHSVSTALCGADALQDLAAKPQAIDIVLCDVNMPGMDGIEFLQALNASAYRGSVILISGEGTRIMHTVQKLLSGSRLQILGAIEKPAGQAAMRELLDRWKPQAMAPRPHAGPVFDCAAIEAATREHQWVLHYQPKASLRTAAITGMEALVRWNHPVHGLVYPDSFITLAEDCGAIDGLTDWVVQAALRQLALWRGLGLQLQMAVNVSMANLTVPGFATRLGSAAREAGVSPQDVILEITESRLMSPAPAPLEALVRLRLQRFGLSIDDFGTGHSSLAQLRDVPFTELKIDRGFVHGARGNPIIRPMLEGSIGIAARLGMQSVGEGVETDEDWHLLREIGCNSAQGYFISRPMTADRLPDWLAGWQARGPGLVAP